MVLRPQWHRRSITFPVWLQTPKADTIPTTRTQFGLYLKSQNFIPINAAPTVNLNRPWWNENAGYWCSTFLAVGLWHFKNEINTFQSFKTSPNGLSVCTYGWEHNGAVRWSDTSSFETQSWDRTCRVLCPPADIKRLIGIRCKFEMSHREC